MRCVAVLYPLSFSAPNFPFHVCKYVTMTKACQSSIHLNTSENFHKKFIAVNDHTASYRAAFSVFCSHAHKSNNPAQCDTIQSTVIAPSQVLSVHTEHFPLSHDWLMINLQQYFKSIPAYIVWFFFITPAHAQMKQVC